MIMTVVVRNTSMGVKKMTRDTQPTNAIARFPSFQSNPCVHYGIVFPDPAVSEENGVQR